MLNSCDIISVNCIAIWGVVCVPRCLMFLSFGIKCKSQRDTDDRNDKIGSVPIILHDGIQQYWRCNSTRSSPRHYIEFCGQPHVTISVPSRKESETVLVSEPVCLFAFFWKSYNFLAPVWFVDRMYVAAYRMSSQQSHCPRCLILHILQQYPAT